MIARSATPWWPVPPEHWNVIVLTLERPHHSTQIGHLIHSISSPEDHHPAMPDDSLYEATYQLDALFQRHGAVFRRATYRVELSQDSWCYEANFEYGSDRLG